MKRTITKWKASTVEEIANGSPEMILVSTEEIDVPVPDRELPLWKLKAILKTMNLYESIEMAISSIQEPIKTMAQMSWEYGAVINQRSPTVSLIQSVINLTDEEVDDIFNQAENINI